MRFRSAKKYHAFVMQSQQTNSDLASAAEEGASSAVFIGLAFKSKKEKHRLLTMLSYLWLATEIDDILIIEQFFQHTLFVEQKSFCDLVT